MAKMRALYGSGQKVGELLCAECSSRPLPDTESLPPGTFGLPLVGSLAKRITAEASGGPQGPPLADEAMPMHMWTCRLSCATGVRGGPRWDHDFPRAPSGKFLEQTDIFVRSSELKRSWRRCTPTS